MIIISIFFSCKCRILDPNYNFLAKLARLISCDCFCLSKIVIVRLEKDVKIILKYINLFHICRNLYKKLIICQPYESSKFKDDNDNAIQLVLI